MNVEPPLPWPYRIIELIDVATLGLWAFLVYGFWWGYLPRSWFSILGPISAPIFLFATPIVCVLILGLINRSRSNQ